MPRPTHNTLVILYLVEVLVNVTVQPVMNNHIPCTIVVGKCSRVPPILKKYANSHQAIFTRIHSNTVIHAHIFFSLKRTHFGNTFPPMDRVTGSIPDIVYKVKRITLKDKRKDRVLDS